MKKTKKILNALQDHLNLKSFKELAEYLEIETSLLYSWVRHDKISGTGKILAKCRYLNNQWLETGEGPMIIIDDSNKHLVPRSQNAPDDSPFVKPKIAARIEPGNEESREKLHRKSLERVMKAGKKSANTETGEEEFELEDMQEMTAVVLTSKTVYRSALASNVRAFYQAVINEDEMNTVSERLKEIQLENKKMAERMERMEQMLLSMGANEPQKREQNQG